MNNLKYCSKQCYSEAQDKKITLICPHCNKPYKVSPSYKTARKYCSNECANECRPPFSSFKNKILSQHRTDIEAAMETVLQELGFNYVFEKRFSKFWVDFYLPDLHIAIECDEPFWHQTDHQKDKDKAKEMSLKARFDLSVLRFTTQEINGDIKPLLLQRLSTIKESAQVQSI